MIDALADFKRARQLATGALLDVDPPDLAPRCATEAEFAGLVTAYYKLFSESLARDVTFLMKLERSSVVENCRLLIHNLRTVMQHTDNPDAVARVDAWRAANPAPQVAADALAAALSQALVEITRVAVLAYRNPDSRAAWRDVVAIDVATVFVAVSADLGLTFSQGRQRFMVRQVEGRLKVDRTRGDRRTIVADFCVQEIVSDRKPLPVPYSDVLDALGLLGDRDAAGAILIAHSVAEISPRLTRDEFLTRVHETWKAAQV